MSFLKDGVAIIKILAKKISNLELDILASNGPAEGFYKQLQVAILHLGRGFQSAIRFVSINSPNLCFVLVSLLAFQ